MRKNLVSFELIPLKKHLRTGGGDFTQVQTAEQVGASQGYISDVLINERAMYIVNDNGEFKMVELTVVKGRPLPIPTDRNLTVLAEG